MTNTELNKYIKHYLTEDKTKSAIMLTGDWGTGKSYYILNELIPYLSKEKNGAYKCVTVSLYGITNIEDISKNIYLELRMKFKPLQSAGNFFQKAFRKNHKEIEAYGKIIGKTFLKGLFDRGGLELSTSNDAIQELYDSVDLSGKLIIFEDVERAKINILEFLGYVNSLVEQDGVKVLLVANEEEFINYEINGKLVEKYNEADEFDFSSIFNKTKSSEETQDKELTASSAMYLRVKEKTISDTVNYTGDFDNAINMIMKQYSELSMFYDDGDIIKEICGLFNYRKCYNLRTFCFACQKSNDILSKLNGDYSNDFKKCIFYSIILYSAKLKSGRIKNDSLDTVWDSNQKYSDVLGSQKYPLFYFCYQYVQNHVLLTENIDLSFAVYKNMQNFNPNVGIDNKDFQVICSCYDYSEKQVLQSINKIITQLEENSLPISIYGRLAYYLVQLRFIVEIEFDYEKAKKYLIDNIKGHGDDLIDEIFYFDIERGNTKAYDKYKEIKSLMLESASYKKDNYFNFDYQPESIKELSKYIFEKRGNLLTGGFVAKYLENDKLIEMLYKCSSRDITELRKIYYHIYNSSNIGEYLSGDLSTIIDLKEKLQSIIDDEKFDKIQRLQIKYFIDNLEEIAQKLK